MDVAAVAGQSSQPIIRAAVSWRWLAGALTQRVELKRRA